MKLGFFFGTGIVYCDPKLSGIASSKTASFNPRAAFRANLFDKVDELTPEFIKALTPEECNRMLDAYARAFLGFSRMKDIQATPDSPGARFGKEALDDLNQSAMHLTASKPNYGFSRWSSLQAAEKTLKCYAVQNGGKLLKTHHLTKRVRKPKIRATGLHRGEILYAESTTYADYPNHRFPHANCLRISNMAHIPDF